MFKYIVQPTDTLHFIALKFNIPVKELIYTNNLADPNKLYPGQSLLIPSLPNRRQNKLPQLYPGCKDDSFIILLQSQLAKLGFYQDDIDGVFGCMTHRAILSFQMENKLEPSGFVDQNTWTKLFESANNFYDLPNYRARLIPPGVLIVLTTDKLSYAHCDTMVLTLLKINLTAKPLIFTYGTDQRYDFTINDSHGNLIWQWSDDKEFSKKSGSISLSPYQTISFTENIKLSSILSGDDLGELWAMGWNTPFQTHMFKMHLPLTVQRQSH